MAGQKKSSCFGLFLKSSFISSLGLASLVIVGAIVHIKFFQGSIDHWTDFSGPVTRPMLALYAVLGTASLLGLFLGLAGAAISAIFSGSTKKRAKAAPPRPQSNRRTTV